MQLGRSFDQRLLQWIDQHRIAPLTSLTRTLMDVGTSMPFIVACSIVGLSLAMVFRAWRAGLAVVIAVVVAGRLSGVLKDHIERARPPHDLSLVQLDGYAMPSSHGAVTSAAAVALLLAIGWRSRRQRNAAATTLASFLVVIAASMVYLGTHWATDILVGWALGLVVGAGVGAAFRLRTGQSAASPVSAG